MPALIFVLILCLLPVSACGEKDFQPKDANTEDSFSMFDGSPTDAGFEDAVLADAITIDSSMPDSSEMDGSLSSCESAKVSLAAEFFAELGSCTVTARFRYQDQEFIGYRVFCSSYDFVDQSTARQVAVADNEQGTYSIYLPSTESMHLWYSSPSDIGKVAAVASYTGKSVFGGSIIWDGMGSITLPVGSWRSPGSAGVDCEFLAPINTIKGIDLRDGNELEASTFNAIIEAIKATAIPAAMWSGGYVEDAVVLLYPRSVGIFDPTTAEYVLLLTSRWLD